MEGELVQTGTVGMTVEQGASPWELTRDFPTELVEVFERYDMPLSGMVRQNGEHIVFQCVIGHTENLHLWLYNGVLADVAEALLDADAEELTALLGELSHTPGVLALATDRLGIVSLRPVDPMLDVETPIRELYDDLTQLLDETRTRAQHQARTAEMAFA